MSRTSLWCLHFAAYGIYALVPGVLLLRAGASRFGRPDYACGEQKTGSCLAVESGFVESVSGDFLNQVTVVYDDGRQRGTVAIAGDEVPAVGSLVRFEWWNGELVALYQPSNERRFKAYNTVPEGWDATVEFYAALGLLSAAVLLFLPLLGLGLVRLGRRLRSQTASLR